MVTREASPADASRICEIYNHYVAETTITFEEQPVSESVICERMSDSERGFPWLVCDLDGVVGFAFASPWKSRCSYRYSAESSIYLDPDFTRRGLGRPLYEALLAHLQAGGYRSAIGGIALPNEASIALHEKCGFTKVAQFEQVGFKFDRWIDVGYWQRML